MYATWQKQKKRKRPSSPGPDLDVATTPSPSLEEPPRYPRAQRTSFLGHLYDMVSSPNDLARSIIWSPDGRRLIICDPEHVETKLLPIYFPRYSLRRVLRYLTFYEFSHETTDVGHILLSHPKLTQNSTLRDFCRLRRVAEPPPRVTYKTFMGVIYDMVLESNQLTRGIISWSADGRSIVISDLAAFEKDVLPVYLPGQKNTGTFTGSMSHFSFGYKTEHATKSLFLTHRQLTISSSREDFLAIPHIHHGPGATPPPPRQARYRPPPETESDALPRAPKPKRKLHGPRSRGSFFLGNLHDMLASATPRTLEIISWSPDGAGLLLFDADAFENELMPVFFPQHRRIKSFLGALYLYGFTNGPTRKEYGKGPMRFVHQTLTQASPREAFDAVLPRKSPSQIKSWELGGEDAGAQRPKIVAGNADSEGSSKRRKTVRVQAGTTATAETSESRPAELEAEIPAQLEASTAPTTTTASSQSNSSPTEEATSNIPSSADTAANNPSAPPTGRILDSEASDISASSTQNNNALGIRRNPSDRYGWSWILNTPSESEPSTSASTGG
ncbi:hypothetical protein C8F01DRAFT_1366843 [Mycena amicta]|nr:hypothetical protein C8F01DRAFT_1366843 [Mycena amicta]